MESKTYDIGGRIFALRPMVLGQFQQILGLLRDMAMPADLNGMGVVAAMGDKLSLAMAIVLVEEHTDLAGRNMEELADFMRDHADLSTALEVAEDFLSINRVSSLAERLARLGLEATPAPTSSPNGASPSPAATSPEGTGSCGTSP